MAFGETGPWSPPRHSKRPIFSAAWPAQLLCRREKRGTVERDRYLSPHHSEQNADASRGVESLKRAHEIGKRSRQDTNCLPSGQTGIEERQIGFVSARDEGFHDAFRDGDRPILA